MPIKSTEKAMQMNRQPEKTDLRAKQHLRNSQINYHEHNRQRLRISITGRQSMKISYTG